MKSDSFSIVYVYLDAAMAENNPGITNDVKIDGFSASENETDQLAAQKRGKSSKSKRGRGKDKRYHPFEPKPNSNKSSQSNDGEKELQNLKLSPSLNSENDFPKLGNPTSQSPYPKPVLTPIKQPPNPKEIEIYLVFDTNVWLLGLDVISEIYHDENLTNFVIYIPDIVAIELDKLKDRKPFVDENGDIPIRARKAIEFQNKGLQVSLSQHPKRVQLQPRETAEDAYKSYTCYKNDDKVIATCLQLKHESKDVGLCTRDKSMQNFAGANGIKLYPQISPELQDKLIQGILLHFDTKCYL